MSSRRSFATGKLQPVGNMNDFLAFAAKSNELAVYVQRGPVGHFVALSKTTK